MKYLLLFCGTQEEVTARQALSEEARAQQRAKSSQFLMVEHAAQVRRTCGLHLPHTVTSVHTGSGGQPLVTDGPFIEGTEVIGGLAEIEVADLEEALSLAKMYAALDLGYSVVEIWPVVGMLPEN